MATRTLLYKLAHLSRLSTEIAMASRGPIARRGAVVVWVAILGVVLIGFVGLAMDAGVVLLAGTHLQIAADAASLDGARLVKDDLNEARLAAIAIAHENKALLFATKAPGPIRLDPNTGNADTGDIVIGRFYRFADDYAVHPRCPNPPCFHRLAPGLGVPDTPNAVRVRARRTSTSLDNHVPLVFGAAPLFNVQGIDVTRSATAMRAGSTGAGMLLLDPDGDCALEVGGSAYLIVRSDSDWDGDTAIQVNSDNPHSFCVHGGANTKVQAPETNLVASDPGYDFDGNPVINTYVNPDSPYMVDPLEDLQPPPTGADRGTINPPTDAPTYFEPGYYSGGMNISGKKKILLGTASPGKPPGIYIFGGSGFQRTGSASITALNVMIYLESGPLDLGGNGSTTITPMTDHPEYGGVSIFQARDNLEVADITGNPSMNLEGTYYFPRNRLEVGGTSTALGNQLIAWQLYLHGDGNFEIEYDGRFQSPNSKVFLVQ